MISSLSESTMGTEGGSSDAASNDDSERTIPAGLRCRSFFVLLHKRYFGLLVYNPASYATPHGNNPNASPHPHQAAPTSREVTVPLLITSPSVINLGMLVD